MDKRQLRQSAMADFMQSLEHLDELLGDTAEHVVLDSRASQPETAPPTSQPVALPTTHDGPEASVDPS